LPPTASTAITLPRPASRREGGLDRGHRRTWAVARHCRGIDRLGHDKGRVVVAICDKTNFPKGRCAYHGQTPAKAGEVIVRVAGVPPGTWAAAVYHDEIGDRPLEFTLFGFPKQAVGFSRDAKMNYGPPKFADAAFTLLETQTIVTACLRYAR
jgi:uncharacterized protein (DUF2141 family)